MLCARACSLLPAPSASTGDTTPRAPSTERLSILWRGFPAMSEEVLFRCCKSCASGGCVRRNVAIVGHIDRGLDSLCGRAVWTPWISPQPSNSRVYFAHLNSNRCSSPGSRRSQTLQPQFLHFHFEMRPRGLVSGGVDGVPAPAPVSHGGGGGHHLGARAGGGSQLASQPLLATCL